MTKSLILALSAEPGGPVIWGLGSDAGTPGTSPRVEATGRVSGLDQAAELPLGEADRIIAVVPGSDVLARDVTLPARRESEARAAVPYLLEDDLASDPETLHFALGKAGEGGARRVAVVASDTMERWRATLEPIVKDRAYALIADFEALEPPRDGARVVDRGDRVIVVPSDRAGFTTEPELAPMVMPETLGEVTTIRLETDQAERLTEGFTSASVATAPALTDGAYFSEVLDAVREGRVTDLLQGRFAPDGDFSLSLDVWRRATVLAATVALAYAIMLAGQGWHYDRLADDRHAQALGVFRTAFPEVTRIVNPQAQMNAELAALKGGGTDDYLRLSSLLFDSVENLPGVELRDLRYMAERGEVAASIAYGAYGDVEALKTAVANRGGVFGEGGSRQRGDRIIGEITIGLQ